MIRRPREIGADRARGPERRRAFLGLALPLGFLLAWAAAAGASAAERPGAAARLGAAHVSEIGGTGSGPQGPDGAFRSAQLGEVTPDKLERWRRLPPEERDRIRERYRRWKELPPERRERILERQRRWGDLPEADRHFLRERRQIYRNAWPEEKRVIRRFFTRWRELPPERRRQLRARLLEWRDLPAAERDERMMDWSFYSRLSPEERKVISRFLFSEPPPAAAGPRSGQREPVPRAPGGPLLPPGPPHD